MNEARWEGLKSGHEREIREIKRLIESPPPVAVRPRRVSGRRAALPAPVGGGS